MTRQATRHISTTEAIRLLRGDDDAIVASCAAYLNHGEVVWDLDGNAAGIIYRDLGTFRWYAATCGDCRKLLETIAASPGWGRGRVTRKWFPVTSKIEHDTRETAIAELVD